MGEIFWYAVRSEDGTYKAVGAALDPYLMTGDCPLFDSAEACVAYWKAEGIGVSANA